MMGHKFWTVHREISYQIIFRQHEIKNKAFELWTLSILPNITTDTKKAFLSWEIKEHLKHDLHDESINFSVWILI